MRTTWLILACLIGLLAPLFGRGEEPQYADTSALLPTVIIPIRGEINDYSRAAFLRRVTKARELGAKAIIVELDTPGGLVTSAIELTHTIRGFTDLKTIAWVNEKAYSAGSMIAVACDEIAMAPGAVIGDCAPIMLDDQHHLVPVPSTERAKMESPIIADFLDSARRNGYDPLLMEAMVSVDRVIYLLESPTGQRKVADEKGREELLAAGWKLASGVRQPVDSDKTLLTVSTNDAVAIGLCKIKAATAGDIASQRNLHLIATLNPGAGEWIIELLNSGVARMILLSVFMTCLYAALHAPGHGMAEVLALLTLGLLIGVPLLTGYAQWWEILIIFLGLGLVALEIFVIPGFGVVGIAGAVLLLGGFILTFAAPEVGRPPLSLPKLAVTWSSLQKGLLVTFGGLVCSLILSMWLRRYLPKLPYFKGLILNTTVGSSDAAMVGSLTNIDPAATGPALGATGTATTDLLPGGTAEFRDAAGGSHVVAVISDGGYVARGATVVVRESSGNRVVVRPSSQA